MTINSAHRYAEEPRNSTLHSALREALFSYSELTTRKSELPSPHPLPSIALNA
uniref:Uncharacterized protein n=1 Tax=Desertifilum tharense IPPAS B-1220 TaxID=1781255 RepID=A0ACD5GTM9_9CYAN